MVMGIPLSCTISLHSVYFESITWDELTNGFEHVPGGDSYRNRSVVSYHFYIPPDVSQCSVGGCMAYYVCMRPSLTLHYPMATETCLV